MPKQTTIDPLSVVPLFLEGCAGNTSIGSGTGFVVQEESKTYLVTNWHMVSGRDPTTGQPLSSRGAIPDTLAVWHHVRNKLGTWARRFVSLKAEKGTHPWLEHPEGRRIDVVALPLDLDDEVQIYPLDLNLVDTDLIVSPSEAVSIIGFPFGLSSGGRLPIWKTGHVASDIDLDYDGQPVFLIDATTRPGMSGSPVIARRIGMYRSSKGLNVGGKEANRFLGVYSGRIHEGADVGMVWKPEVLAGIIR